MKTRVALGVFLSAAMALPLAACNANTAATGGGESSADNGVTINYWLWDDRQAPLYQQCADDFHAANPNITVKITQTAWGQYWDTLTTQLAASNAPDTFVDHSTRMLQFIDSGQIMDITEAANKAGIDDSIYQPGLADLSKYEGKRYGLPKDWDTMGLLYDTEVAAEAGYTKEDMAALTWNPTDGGTFEQFIAKTTLDANGHNGLDPEFDKNNVVRYGYHPEWSDGAIGQNGWGELAAANGFTYGDRSVNPTKFNFGDKSLVDTVAWIKGLIDKGYAPKFDKTSSLGTDAVMNNGNAASTIAGSFTTSVYLGPDAKKKFAYAPLPTGPAGRRSAMNGLHDVVWSGTKHPEEAFQWIAYMASEQCQMKVGESGVIFPAVTKATEASLKAREAQGQDNSAFTTVVDNKETFPVPVFAHGDEVNALIQDAIQAIATGADPASTLQEANDKANALLK